MGSTTDRMRGCRATAFAGAEGTGACSRHTEKRHSAVQRGDSESRKTPSLLEALGLKPLKFPLPSFRIGQFEDRMVD